MRSEENKTSLFAEICDFPIPSYEQWKQAVDKSLKGAPFSKLLTKTYEEIILEPIYQKKDIENLAFTKTVPGQFPFVRGTQPADEKKSWLIAQEMNHPIPEKVNEWLRNDLQKGVNAINLVLNEATKMGNDYSEKNSQAGQVGTMISSLEDIETTFAAINVQDNPFVVQTGVSAVPFVTYMAAYFQKNNLPLTNLKGCIGADPLAMLVKNGQLPFEMDSYLDQMAELLKWTEINSPELKTIFIDSHAYHDGGGSAVDELASMLATGVYYIRELQKRGLLIDQIASTIQLSISVGSNLFMELAKIRAARMLWANIIEAFGGNEASQKLKIHARTSRWTKTVYDPYVNILRSTVEAFTAAVGGVDSLHVSSFDEAFTLANDFSRRVARNCQLVIQEEAHVTYTADPVGGSWYVETITAELASKGWGLFQLFESQGGMLQALQKGKPQQHVKEVSAKKKEDIEKRKLIFVGATMYANKTENQVEVDNESLDTLIEKQALAAKARLQVAVSINPSKVVNDVIRAAKQGATIGAISKALGSGKGISLEKIEIFRATEAFEKLRQYCEEKKTQDAPISVFLISIGALADHKPRTDFVANFFETGGFEVVKSNGFETVETALAAATETTATIAVICGKNQSYNEMAVEILAGLKKQTRDMKVFVAGKQDEVLEGKLREVGVNGFIHVGTNCYQLLRELQGEKVGNVDE
ncbi:methylmalonyl-CoA mutase family protein [Bacillaceae bacterium IKA-2]|nr:methylmalonyl-CoA mutase family protein [Bacillaceae bacterium IKA-2]